MEIVEALNYHEAARALLSENKLPVDDLPSTPKNFFVAVDDGEVMGVAGLEIYGNYGLLRSVAVKSDGRGRGIAGKLVDRIEQLAAGKGLKEVYLLTETADKYFDNKHYIRITRADVPAEIQQSSEYSSVCPQSAVVMKKIL